MEKQKFKNKPPAHRCEFYVMDNIAIMGACAGITAAVVSATVVTGAAMASSSASSANFFNAAALVIFAGVIGTIAASVSSGSTASAAAIARIFNSNPNPVFHIHAPVSSLVAIVADFRAKCMALKTGIKMGCRMTFGVLLTVSIFILMIEGMITKNNMKDSFSDFLFLTLIPLSCAATMVLGWLLFVGVSPSNKLSDRAYSFFRTEEKKKAKTVHSGQQKMARKTR